MKLKNGRFIAGEQILTRRVSGEVQLRRHPSFTLRCTCGGRLEMYATDMCYCNRCGAEWLTYSGRGGARQLRFTGRYMR